MTIQSLELIEPQITRLVQEAPARDAATVTALLAGLREVGSPLALVIARTLEYLDEFTVGLIDSTATYRSWRTSDVQYKVDSPVDAHVELFSKYTDADIHNLMAYMQTLR